MIPIKKRDFSKYNFLSLSLIKYKNNVIINKDTLVVQTDYLPLFFSANGNFSGEVVFAGYGFQINEKELKTLKKTHYRVF